MSVHPRYETLHARVRELEAAVARLESTPQTTVKRPSKKNIRRFAVGLAGILLAMLTLEAGRSYAQSSACPQMLPASMVTFCANAPAVANEMNQNFQWVVDKVGPFDSGLQTTSVSATDVTATRVDTADITAAGGVFDRLQVNQQFLPMYSGWRDPGPATGGAAIVNDNQAFQKLMIVGNNSEGNVRQIGLWDDVTVSRNLSVQGTLLFERQGCHHVVGRGTWMTCPDGEFVAGIDHDNNNDGIGGVYCCQF